MRLIDADELIKGRAENDPVKIASERAPTACDVDKIIKKLEDMSGVQFDSGNNWYQLDWCIDTNVAIKIIKNEILNNDD